MIRVRKPHWTIVYNYIGACNGIVYMYTWAKADQWASMPRVSACSRQHTCVPQRCEKQSLECELWIQSSTFQYSVLNRFATILPMLVRDKNVLQTIITWIVFYFTSWRQIAIHKESHWLAIWSTHTDCFDHRRKGSQHDYYHKIQHHRYKAQWVIHCAGFCMSVVLR